MCERGAADGELAICLVRCLVEGDADEITGALVDRDDQVGVAVAVDIGELDPGSGNIVGRLLGGPQASGRVGVGRPREVSRESKSR